ncbi:unnamed protein product [Colias eurytheme]|nr:unnamed protein product [Colias eurytheme]
MSSKSEQPAKTSRNQAAEAPSRQTRTLREKALARAAAALPPTTSKTTLKPLPSIQESQAAGGDTQDEMETSSVGSETSI